jgi:hypothetical protein
MLKDVNMSAAALYDGGWRSTDAEQLMDEYDLTQDEADAICEELKMWEPRTVEAAELERLTSPKAAKAYSHTEITISIKGGTYEIRERMTGDLITTADTPEDLNQAVLDMYGYHVDFGTGGDGKADYNGGHGSAEGGDGGTGRTP